MAKEAAVTRPSVARRRRMMGGKSKMIELVVYGLFDWLMPKLEKWNEQQVEEEENIYPAKVG